MKLDTATIERAVMLVTYHDVRLTAKETEVKRWLRRLGEEAFFQLLEVQKADVRGQHPDLLYRIQDIETIGQTAREVLASQACFSLKDLQVNGHDLIQIGIYPGKLLGTHWKHCWKRSSTALPQPKRGFAGDGQDDALRKGPGYLRAFSMLLPADGADRLPCRKLREKIAEIS